MNKGASTWLRNYKFEALGLPVPEDLEEYFRTDEYFEMFMAPACFITSGMKKSDFNWELAEAGTWESQNYLSNDIPKLLPPNSIIQLLNSLNIGNAWMYILRDLVDYTVPSTDSSHIISGLREAYRKFMETHEVRFACFGSDCSDVPVIVNSTTGKIHHSFPQEYVLYPTNIRANYGTHILQDACAKPYYKLTPVEYDLLRIADEVSIAGNADYKTVSIPYVTNEGAVAHKDVTWKDNDKLPNDVINLMSAMPKSLIDEYGDEIHALIAMCDDSSATYSDAVRDYIESVRDKLVDDYDTPKARMLEDAELSSLKSQGYVCTNMTEVLRDFCAEYKMSHDCTIAQLLEFLEAPPDVVIPPEPFNTKPIEPETTNAKVDDTVLSIEEFRKTITYTTVPEDIWDSIKAKHHNSGETLLDWYPILVHTLLTCTESADIDRTVDVVSTAEEKGIPTPFVERVLSMFPEGIVSSAEVFWANLCSVFKTAYEEREVTPAQPAVYVDKFEEAGALMLHRIRESIITDASIANRSTLTDVLYGYFRLMMGDAVTEFDEVLAALQDRANNAQPAGKRIIEEGISIIKND